MVIEHTFVTTLDSMEAMRQASLYLTQQGYEVLPQQAFGMTADLQALSFRRGKARATGAKRLDELPQQLQLEYDRGRVTVAASIDSSVRRSFSISGGAMPDHHPKLEMHRQLLFAVVQGLEHTIGLRPDPRAVATARANAQASVAHDLDRRRRGTRNMWIAFGIVMAALATVVTLVIVNS